jgi:hypothetical protein
VNLSEIVSRIGSGTFPIVSLVIFLVVFLAITVKTMRPSARDEQQRARQLPLDGGES